MAKQESNWALVIGAQSDQATVNPAVENASDIITGPSTGTDATGILLRREEDISFSAAAERGDAGLAPGSESRLAGPHQRNVATASFVIDMMGNRNLTGTPDADDYDVAEYMLRILAGARLSKGTGDPAFTPYRVIVDNSQYQSIKIWRNARSWTLVGCTFGLLWDFVAGEVCRMTTTIHSDSIIYNNSDTFPIVNLDTAFGNQLGAAPILELAELEFDGVTQGMQSCSIGIDHAQTVVGDSNITGGKANSEGERVVTFSGDLYADSARNDFATLSTALDNTGVSPLQRMKFNLGIAAPGPSALINALSFDFPNLLVEDQPEVVNGDDIVRTISGHGVVAGASGSGSTVGTEFELRAI